MTSHLCYVCGGIADRRNRSGGDTAKTGGSTLTLPKHTDAQPRKDETGQWWIFENGLRLPVISGGSGADDDDSGSDDDDDEEAEPDDDDSIDDEDGDDGDEDSDDAVDALAERLGAQFERVVDRRITSLMKTLQKDYGLAKSGTKKRSGKVSDDDGESRESRDPMLTRHLRTAIRDAVGDEFDDKTERKMALKLAKEIGDLRGLTVDEDEDEIASEIVEQVKGLMGDAKSHFEAAVKKDLKRRGLLQEEDPGQDGKTRATKKGPGKSPEELFRAGQSRAKEKFKLSDKE